MPFCTQVCVLLFRSIRPRLVYLDSCEILQQLNYEFREDDLETNCNPPGVKNQAKLCDFSEVLSVAFLAHIAVGLDLEAIDQTRKHIHPYIRE